MARPLFAKNIVRGRAQVASALDPVRWLLAMRISPACVQLCIRIARTVGLPSASERNDRCINPVERIFSKVLYLTSQTWPDAIGGQRSDELFWMIEELMIRWS